MRIMPDSNTFVSFIMNPNSFWVSIISAASRNNTLVLSDYVIDEVAKAIKKRCPHLLKRWKRYVASRCYELFELPENWRDIIEVPKIRDAKDEPVLASAILANIDVLISGDKDFDEISVSGLMIMKPREFYDWWQMQTT